MIHPRGETLLPPRITRLGPGPANVPRHDLSLGSQHSQRPDEVFDREAPRFPIRHRVLRAQAVEIDRDIDLCLAQFIDGGRKLLPPIVTQDCSTSALFLGAAIVSPRMHFQTTYTL